MKRFRFLHLGFLFLLVMVRAVPVTAQAPTENALLWRVVGPEGTTSYLFGTYHLMPGDLVDESEPLTSALATCELFYGELVLADANPTQMLLQMQMQGQTLKGLLGQDFGAADSIFTRTVGISLKILKTLRPLAVQLILLSKLAPQAEALAADPTAGLDGYLQKVAQEQEIEVRGLETQQEQLNLLSASIPLEEEAAQLREMLFNTDSVRQVMQQVSSCYREEDLGCLAALLNDGGLSPEQTKALLEDRNRSWFVTLLPLLQRQPAFIAVGAGHLVGKKGLIALFREAGFTVSPVPLRP